jgi:multicomponent Na+:H+ antiporter subunit A
VITAAAVLANILTIVAAFLVFARPFFGPKLETPKHAHEAPWSMLLGPIILSGLGLLVGLLVAQFGPTFVGPAVGNILGEPTEVSLHLLPTKFNTTVMLSLITIVGGVGLYFVRDPLNQLVQPFNSLNRVGPEQWYQWTLDGMMALARWQTRVLQSGYLRYYLIIIILTTVGLTGFSLISLEVLTKTNIFRVPQDYFYEYLIYLMIIAATIVVIRTESRLTAVAALGVVGYAIALIFILFGAPDLAMTQFSIETLSIILLVLVLYRLPRFTNFSTIREKSWDMIVAVSGGALMTLLVLIVTALPSSKSRLTPFFAEASYTLAKGHNVVNVILVDFRGFDTMGEITVLGIAAIGVFGLLKLRLDKKDQANQRESE